MSALERILEDYAAHEARASGAQSAAQTAMRRAAAEALRQHALPTRRDENWRYTNLAALDGVRAFQPGHAAASGPLADLLPAPMPGYARLVWVDGRLREELSLPDAALLARLRGAAAAAPRTEPTPFEVSGDGRLGLIACLFAPDPVTLRVAGTLALELISLATTDSGAAYTAFDLQLAPHASLALVERHLGPGAGFSCARLRLSLEADAQLTHARLLQSGAGALHYDTVAARLAERASYSLRHIVAGAGNARSSAEIRLQGREARLQLRALAAAQGPQTCDALFTVHHEAPATRSDQLFRGIAGERARVVCTAHVEVTERAPGSRVQQSLRGLIDGDRAEVDLRPRLAISTDDIQAAHGATTGQLDDNLLFYLLSRGLDPAAARSLLKWAFLGEALSALEPPALRKAAELATAARLADAPAAELLR